MNVSLVLFTLYVMSNTEQWQFVKCGIYQNMLIMFIEYGYSLSWYVLCWIKWFDMIDWFINTMSLQPWQQCLLIKVNFDCYHWAIHNNNNINNNWIHSTCYIPVAINYMFVKQNTLTAWQKQTISPSNCSHIKHDKAGNSYWD